MEHVYEDIDNRYGYGRIGDFEVVIDKQLGMINGTELAPSCGKDYDDWVRDENTRGFIQELCATTGLEESELLVLKRGQKGDRAVINGTYMHPYLFIHLAQWCSPKYYLRTIGVVKDCRDRERLTDRYLE